MAEGWRKEAEKVESLRAEYEAGRATWDQVADAAGRMRLRATRPIMRDLRAVGVRGRDFWDELDIRSHPAAIPVLINHLEFGEFPDDVVNDLGNRIATKQAAAYWERLTTIYLDPRSPAHEEAAAIALSGCATRERYEELVGFVRDESRGPYRSIFLHNIVKLGGSAGWEVVESVADVPDMAQEATEMLKRRARRLRRAMQ